MLVGLPICSQAITITSGPSFSASSNAPLAGSLQLTTDVPARVSVSVANASEGWQRDFHDYATSHSVPLFGFRPNSTNEVTVTVRDQSRNEFTASAPVTVITGPLPIDFPVINLLTNDPERMEPGYTLFRVVNNNSARAFLTIVDNYGQVVWYSARIPNTLEVKQLPDGNLFLPLSTNFIEVDLLGQTIQSWNVPNNLSINSHDGVLTGHGTILYINDDTRVVTDFPSSATNPNAAPQTTSVLFNRIIEMSATNGTGTLLNNWALIDMLDPRRISYLTFTIRNNLGWDCEHANAVLEDPRDDSIIVSMRHQNAVIKFSRGTGQLKWILGPHENWGSPFQPYLLTPTGTPFAWNYGQHAPMITPQGTLLVYDDGNFRASPFDPTITDMNNYSRAVEYDINEQTREVTQVWEYGGNISEPLFTSRVCNTDWLPKSGNVLVTFGNVDYINHAKPSPYSPAATMLRIKEVTHTTPAEVVFDLSVFDYNNTNSSYFGDFAYRSHRIPDLYGHPARPVTDLIIKFDTGVPHLQFSADSANNYSIEASSDLVNWTNIGTPIVSSGENYDFDDTSSPGEASRYYRVVTQ